MTPNRREFLGTALAATLPALVSASPVPIPKTPIRPLAPPSDSPPPLPEGAYARLGSRRFRTGKGISRIQFNPTGKVIVAADRDEIRGWDVATAKPIFSMPYPEKVDLNSGRISSVNTIVTLGRVTGANSYEIHHYHFGTGRTEIFAKTSFNNIEQSAFTADGSHVAVHVQGRVHVLDGKTGAELWGASFGSNENRTSDLMFLPDGGPLLISGVDGVKLFEFKTGKELGVLTTDVVTPKKKGRGRNAASILGVVSSADGKLIAGRLSADNTQFRIWTATDAKLVQSLKSKDGDLPLGFTADGKELIVESEGTLIFYSVATGKSARTIDVGGGRSLTLSPDCQYVGSSNDDAVVLFDTATGKLHPLAADPPGLPNRLEYLNPQTLRGTMQSYGGWVEWNLTENRSELIRVPKVGAAIPVGLSADRRTAVMHHDGKMMVWDVKQGTLAKTLKVESNRSIPLAALTRNGASLVTATENGISTWDLQTGKPVAIKGDPGTRPPAEMFALSDDGDTAALAGPYATDPQTPTHLVEIYSRAAGQLLQRIRIRGSIRAMKFSPDGSRLVLATMRNDNNRGGWNGDGHDRNSLQILDTRSGRILLQTPPQPTDHRWFAISPDNRLVLAEGAEQAIEVWELLGGRKRMTFLPKSNTDAVAVAPDGETFATSGGGGPILLWDLRGRRRAKLSKPDGKTIDGMCDRLADTDAAIALQAIRTIAAWPEETLPVLLKRIEPVKPPDAEKLKQWIDDLDAPAFRDRDKASRELQALGDLAMPALKTALATTGSDEVRQRAGDLIEQLDTAQPTDLRALRAAEAAEWAGGETAKAALRKWASGAAGARLTMDAKAALKRMK